MMRKLISVCLHSPGGVVSPATGRLHPLHPSDPASNTVDKLGNLLVEPSKHNC